LLEDTEQEAKLAVKWILQITSQDNLELKTMTKNFHSAEIFLLHKIQSKWMSDHRELTQGGKQNPGSQTNKLVQQQINNLNTFIQISILAISEALGFGG